MEINSENEFNTFIQNDVVIVDFFATWCGPCKMQGPILEDFSSAKNIKITSVDVDKFPSLARTYAVMSIPTLILFKNGTLIDKKIGLTSATELEEWV